MSAPEERRKLRKTSSFEGAMTAFRKDREKSSEEKKTITKRKASFKSSVRAIMAVSRMKKKPKYDNHVKIAYPGSIGSFAELAAKDYFDECKDVKYVGSAGFKRVFDMVESGEVQYGIIPIENSRSGVLTPTLDLLISHNIYIVGETSCEEGHFLCALPGVARGDIKKVYSHPHILSQCDKFLQVLKEENKGLERVCTASSSAAIAAIKSDQNKFGAAVASKEAAEHEGMIILEEGIADYHPIATRYIILGQKHASFADTRDRKLKSTICVSIGNQTGSLFKILSCFALRGVDIGSIHSRPASTAPDSEHQNLSLRHWDLIFYIDYVPSHDADINKSLLMNVREYSDMVRELGTYEENNPNREIDGWYSKNQQSNMLDCVYY